MEKIAVQITGVSPLLQHRYPMATLEEMASGATKKTGTPDYTQEWRKALYVNNNGVFQPASHIEGALVKAAVAYKIKGGGRKTYKDLFRAAVFVTPEEIPHNIPEPKELDTDADKELYLDMRPVVIQRSRIVRIRPALKSGWQLDFEIEVLDEQIATDLVHDVLSHAGKVVGIGDYRPKFGRFIVTHFEVL